MKKKKKKKVMKKLKLFEDFSKETFNKLEWQGQVLEASNVIDILYDLKEVALEYLDVRHTHLNDDDEEELVDKKIVFIVDLHDKEVEYLGNLFGGEYSFENIDIEENLYWSNDITAPVEEIVEGFKSGKLYLNITFSIVAGEDGHVTAVNDDTGNVWQRISDMYPEVGFDTFNPWDLN
jgi:hypothetical protein